MGNEFHPELLGFDSYEVKLGDELRGERASKGKTLLDVQRDLRIRADYIAAIEDADASAFPFAGFAAGYVRTYARYLDLDADEIYRRFCEESGFTGVEATSSMEPTFGHEEKKAPQRNPRHGGAAISTRFMPSHRETDRIEIGASVRGLASLSVLAAVIVGLGYGGWAVLENLQRVGFAPLPSAPDVIVAAPEIVAPGAIAGEATASDFEVSGIGSLAAVYAAQEVAAPRREARDGPISSIDPNAAGIYAPPAQTIDPTPIDLADMPDAPDGGVDPRLRAAAALTVADAMIGPVAFDDAKAAPASLDDAQSSAISRQGLVVYAAAEAWVRIRDEADKVIFTGILGAGERFSAPAGSVAASLRAGNAGSVYIILDGVAFGPLGEGPVVAKNVTLAPESVRAAFPRASDFDATVVDKREASIGGVVALSSQ